MLQLKNKFVSLISNQIQLNMNTAARIARIAMWVMIGAIILTFFIRDSWVRTLWVIAAVVCLISILFVAYYKSKNRYR